MEIIWIAAVLILILVLLVNSWRRTEFGILDTKVALVLKLISRRPNLLDQGASAQEIRTSADAQFIKAGGKPVPLSNIKNMNIPGPAGEIPIRIYTPDNANNAPILVFYHGGGWVIGSIDTHDNICRKIAIKSEMIVISVGYRLAPENTFPAAFDDAQAALEWAYHNASSINGDPARISVGGDSAGGNLAAAVSLSSRDRHGPRISSQVLLYPVTDISGSITTSYKNFSAGYFLTKQQMDFFGACYIPEKSDRSNPYVSPLLAPDVSNLPPALVITAGFDPLRDEGEAYAAKLEKAGVPVQASRYDGVIHGFISMGAALKSKSNKAIDEIAGFLKKYR